MFDHLPELIDKETVSKLPAPTAEVEAILECFSTLDRLDALTKLQRAIMDLRAIVNFEVGMAEHRMGHDYSAFRAAIALASLTAVESYLAGEAK